MLNLVVCIKQVPSATELPWNDKARTLKREAAEGMMDPSSRHALEAALQMKKIHEGNITVLTMGPLMAEEVLHEACAMGADQGVLLSDKAMAGADTSITAYTLAKAVTHVCPAYDLIFCGCQTSDSETAQVGPQMAEELDIPGIAYVNHLQLSEKTLRVRRMVDNFLETLEFDLPGLVTVSTQAFKPRYVPLEGLQTTFEANPVLTLTAKDLGGDEHRFGADASPTQILDVYSPVAEKKNVILSGPIKKIVEELFHQFDYAIGGAIGKDVISEEGGNE